MNPQLLREVGGVVLALGAGVVVSVLGVALGMDREWAQLGLLVAALSLGVLSVAAMRYDPERGAMRRAGRAQRRAQATRAAQGDPRPVRMPQLPPRNAP